MEINDLIKNYLGNDTVLSPSFLAEMSEAAVVLSFKKGEIIIKEGEFHPYFYFLQQGGIRSYYLANGLEIINWFAFENEWVGSIQSTQGAASRDSFECMEDCKCIRFDIQKFKSLQKEDIVVANVVNFFIEEFAIFLEDRLRQLQHREAMDRYLYVVEHEPEYLQRVPLTYLASYLGISRETLSRIRRRIIS
ncbi:MAG: Crp/Fnr family transcriptional regulator [Bacteroidia bacterium]|nr:Crp/Fnr family transcriptional regulator [Bacteroidia bacterium]